MTTVVGSHQEHRLVGHACLVKRPQKLSNQRWDIGNHIQVLRCHPAISMPRIIRVSNMDEKQRRAVLLKVPYRVRDNVALLEPRVREHLSAGYRTRGSEHEKFLFMYQQRDVTARPCHFRKDGLPRKVRSTLAPVVERDSVSRWWHSGEHRGMRLALPTWPREHRHVDDDPGSHKLRCSLLYYLSGLLRGA